MKRPITPMQGQQIKAEHLRSHAEAIQWLYEKIKNIKPRTISESGSSAIPLPFQITANASLLIATPGIIGETSISGAALEEASPADGTWHLVAKVVINSTTGEVTSEEVYWNASLPTNTTTDFHVSIASVEITAGEVTDSFQFNYGPIYVNVGGGATDIWSVVIL